MRHFVTQDGLFRVCMQFRDMPFSKGHRFGRCERLQGAKNLGLLPEIAFENEILTCTARRRKCRLSSPQNGIHW